MGHSHTGVDVFILGAGQTEPLQRKLVTVGVIELTNLCGINRVLTTCPNKRNNLNTNIFQMYV